MRRAPVLTLLFVGCAAPGAGTPEIQDLNEMERVADELEREGNYALAREQLDAIASETQDLEHAGALRLRACDTYRREQMWDEARRCYLGIAPNVLPSVKARARHRAAEMEVRLGRIERAKRALEALVIDQPSTEGAESGVRYLLELVGEGGAEDRVAMATRLSVALQPQAELDDAVRALCTFLWLDVGRTLRDLDVEESATALARAWELGAETIWRDELYLARARTAAAAQRHDAALELYGDFLDDRESSWFIGSYDSPYLGRAAQERAELLERIGRTEAAIDAYEWLVEELPDSKFRDDAAFGAARLKADRGDQGALRSFIRDYPESRHVPAARQRLGEGS